MRSFEERRKWFDENIRSKDHGVTDTPITEIRYTCPCCGYPTLSGRVIYDICELCNWEDDGQDDPDADVALGGPNETYSLSDARSNFKRYLLMYNPDKPTHRIGGNTNTELEKQAKRKIIEAFDMMVGEPNPKILTNLWHSVYEQEQVLKSELKRKVRDHESQQEKRAH